MVLVVLSAGSSSVAVEVDDETCLNHVAQLARFIGPDVMIAVLGDTEKKWTMRGQRTQQLALLGAA